MAASSPPTNPAAAAPAESRTAETVCFARQARLYYKRDRAYLDAQQLANRVKGLAFAIGFGLLAILLDYLGPPLPGWAFLIFLCLIILPIGFWPRISNSRFARKYRLRLPLMPPEACRLCCVGAPEELAEFGEWADVPFEPALFFGRFAIRGRAWPRWLYTVIAACVFLTLFGLSLYRVRLRIGGLVWAEMALALGLAEVATAFLWPTYIRLVPGRLDVLGYGPLSKKPVFLDQYDLRKASITTDLRRSFVSILTKGTPHSRQLEFGISLMMERKRFVYMLFLAAMSSYQPGPLPKDDLLG